MILPSSAVTEPWVPLLEGGEAGTALRLIDGIADDLTTFEAAHPAALDEAGTLSRGRAGMALFHLHRASALGDPDAAVAAVGLLNTAVDDAAALPLGPDLFDGLAGLGFVVAQAAPRLGWDADDLLGGIDATLVDFVERQPWVGHFDLVSGLAGIGVYALERLPSPSGERLVTGVVARLGELGRPAGPGVGWLTPPRLLSDHLRRAAPLGCYDLGLAHGMPGVIAFLARAWAAGFTGGRERALLDGGVAWLAGRESDDPGGRFPAWIVPGGSDHPGDEPPARAAWCYGDPGVAAALALAACAADDSTLHEAARRVGHHAARRRRETTGVVDAGLCHGAAGLAHIFARLHQCSGDPLYADAARAWYRRTLGYVRPGGGLGGFRAWIPNHGAIDAWHDEPGFLEGASGIGLALLAAISPAEPAWDRALLLS